MSVSTNAPLPRNVVVRLATLTVSDIIEAGITVTQRRGLAGLTLAAVANELGITTPAVYHHVPGGKKELVGLIVDALLDRMPLPTINEGSWQDKVEALALYAVHASERYPDVFHYALMFAMDRPAALRAARMLRQVLDEAEFHGAAADRAWIAIYTYVLGWVSLRRHGAAEQDMSYTVLPEGLYGRGLASEQTLTAGLRSLLNGLSDPPEV
jgi:AcrR family transcriptional regulator